MAAPEGSFQGVFQSEVKSMMYIFGDIKTPSAESALLVENIVLKQVRDMVRWASDVSSSTRGGKAVTVTDLLFLFRKDKSKLKRLVKHIELKDICRKTSVLDDEDTSVFENGSNVKKEKFSLEFLSRQDQEDICSDEIDEVQRKRLKSLDDITKDMSVSEYKDFSETRQANFHKNMTRFKEWLDLSTILPSVNIHQNVYSVLGYLAYDTVQEIVELALLVKRDQEGVLSDPMGSSRSPLMSEVGNNGGPMFFNIPTPSSGGSTSTGLSPPSSPKSPTGTSSSSPTQIVAKPKPRKRGRPPKNSVSSVVNEVVPLVTTPPAPPTALQSFHILEALRRYTADSIGPMIPLKTYFSRSGYLPRVCNT